MTTPALPGTIPGLLRRCSPVTNEDGSSRGLIYAMPGYYRAYPDWWGVNWNYLLQPCDATRLYLDLSDPTGRAHAAWWAIANHDPSTLSAHDARVVLLAATGEDMTPEDVERLRLVCLHVAGVRP